MSNNKQDRKGIPLDKSITAYLNKFGIEELNPMQLDAREVIDSKSDMVLLSPTGTGKTLAYLLPLIEALDRDCKEIQMVVIVPSRELAQQVEQVVRKIGSGYKVNAVYGGRSGSQDKIRLKHRPAILIGTPGRLADRLWRDKFSLEHIGVLVLDEFDKSLEIGFEEDMSEIIDTLPNVRQRILTSATTNPKIPEFVGLHKPVFVNYLKEGTSQLTLKAIISPEKDKLETLKGALDFLANEPLIIFCNFRNAVERVSEFLDDHNISHGCFHGGMEQIDRERTLIKFRNGTHHILLATDLAARGLDIPEIKFILHYHIPVSKKEFIHRNGRTARMNSKGIAYILHWKDEVLPDYIGKLTEEKLDDKNHQKENAPSQTKWETIYITGGRRDKISKGDIAGLFYKQGQIQKDQLGAIELTDNCTYAAVHAEVAEKLIEKTNNSRLKKKKVRISII